MHRGAIPPHYAGSLYDAIDKIEDKQELMNLVCTKAALTKYANEEVGLPYPNHPVTPDIEWAKKRWGPTMGIAMERWMAPGISMRLIEERKDKGAYEVTMEKKQIPAENKEVEGVQNKTEGELEPEVEGRKDESKASKAGAIMETEETKEEQY